MTPDSKKLYRYFFDGFTLVLGIALGVTPLAANVNQVIPRFVSMPFSILGVLYALFRLIKYIHRLIDEIDRDRITNKRQRIELDIFQKNAFLEIDKKSFEFEMQKDQWREHRKK